MKVDTLKKRAIIVILSVIIVVESLLLHCTTDILADDEFHQYELYIYSNVVNLQPISVFEKDGEYYIEVSKLADLTRSEIDVNVVRIIIPEMELYAIDPTRAGYRFLKV